MTFQVLRRWWPLAAAVLLLAAVALSAAHATPQLDRVAGIEMGDGGSQGVGPERKQPEARPPTATASSGADLPSWIPALLRALLLAVLAGMAGVALWALLGGLYHRPDTGAEPGGVATLARSDEEILAAVEAGLAELSDEDSDPRRAVIACWLRLEEAAAAAGIPRRPADTATDLVIRLLSGPAEESEAGAQTSVAGTGAGAPQAGTGAGESEAGTGAGESEAGAAMARPGARVASGDVLARFAEVYLEARYATHVIDERMREQARAALRQLRAELTSAVRG